MGEQGKRYDNKFHYDQGRMRQKIQFWQDVATDDGYGGTVVADTLILETFAGKEEPSDYTVSQLNAGQSNYNQYHYFIIRNRKNFIPVKDMRVKYGTELYKVERVKQLDDPCTFLKVLCVVTV